MLNHKATAHGINPSVAPGWSRGRLNDPPARFVDASKQNSGSEARPTSLTNSMAGSASSHMSEEGDLSRALAASAAEFNQDDDFMMQQAMMASLAAAGVSHASSALNTGAPSENNSINSSRANVSSSSNSGSDNETHARKVPESSGSQRQPLGTLFQKEESNSQGMD